MRHVSRFHLLHRSRGYVLVTGLIFLAVLTIVAVIAMRATGLELRMSNNAGLRAKALESSEALRIALTQDLLDAHIYYRGWPNCAGGTENDEFFGAELTRLLKPVNNKDCDPKVENSTGGFLSIADANNDGSPDNIFDENRYVDYLKDPAVGTDDFKDTDATYENISRDMRGQLQVTLVKTVLGAGHGGAMVSGYEGTGTGSAGSGGLMYLETRSIGTTAADGVQSTTGSNYRYVIRPKN